MFALGMSKDQRTRLIALTRLAVKNFNVGDWQALGAYTGCSDIVSNHDRLLRSLSFGDDDYSGNAHGVIFAMAERDAANIGIINEFITEHYGEPEQIVIGEHVSTAPTKGRKITFTPSVFDIPEGGVESDLIAVMTPFAPQFENVFQAITVAANWAGFRTLRAKDIWQHSAVIQDVFSLIFRAQIVVCDFTGKNANVFYEAGIAHTLGKHVVPITQSEHDIPFDLQHHRYLHYLGNSEGLNNLSASLAMRFQALR
tara:strand:- start:11681 stop:12445 length:765 start_codon:yes stop_codon:yes gene_type:complete